MGERARIGRAARASSLAVAVAIHLLILAAFVLTMKTAGPPAGTKSVIVSLLPLALQERRRVASARPRAASVVPAPAPVQPPAVAQASRPLAMVPRPDENLARFGASLRDLFGCQDPDLYHLTAAERARCDARVVKHAKAAPFVPAPIPPEKRAVYDRQVKCRADYDDAPIPPGADMTRGLGYVPRLRDCPPGDR